jgi:hypothetical protein
MSTARTVVDLLLGEDDEPKKPLGDPYKQIARQVARGINKPDPLATSWTGSEAFYVSPPGNYGTVGHSELAMHVGAAGKPILRYALFKNNAGWVSWVQIEVETDPHAVLARGGRKTRVVDGTVGELLPHELRRKHGLT